jgi:hypothetical protein
MLAAQLRFLSFYIGYLSILKNLKISSATLAETMFSTGFPYLFFVLFNFVMLCSACLSMFKSRAGTGKCHETAVSFESAAKMHMLCTTRSSERRQ